MYILKCHPVCTAACLAREPLAEILFSSVGDFAHYPNFENKGVRTKVTFIDYKADVEKDFFMGRFKELFSLSHWSYGSVGCDGCLDWKKVYSPGEEFSHLGGDPRKR